jgi:catechol 2,3-dioxygenase-like lactoylglutathione lyase family enzyme
MTGKSERALEIIGLDHVVLRVVDLEASLHFYVDVLGGFVERELAELGLHQVRLGAHLVDLVPVDSPLGRNGGAAPGVEARNLDHFALQLARFDEASLRAHLESRGVEPGDVATRYGSTGDGPSMYIRDPDGNVVELKGSLRNPDAHLGR